MRLVVGGGADRLGEVPEQRLRRVAVARLAERALQRHAGELLDDLAGRVDDQRAALGQPRDRLAQRADQDGEQRQQQQQVQHAPQPVEEAPQRAEEAPEELHGLGACPAGGAAGRATPEVDFHRHRATGRVQTFSSMRADLPARSRR
ncbi:MAG: hypothetical protein U1F06_02275 [Steroidobacteraceae bacterium]